MRFEIYQDRATEFRWRFVADNGEKMADSAEGYTTKSKCELAIAVLRRGVANASVMDLTKKQANS